MKPTRATRLLSLLLCVGVVAACSSDDQLADPVDTSGAGDAQSDGHGFDAVEGDGADGAGGELADAGLPDTAAADTPLHDAAQQDAAQQDAAQQDAAAPPDAATPDTSWCVTSLAEAPTPGIPPDPPNPTLLPQPDDPGCSWPTPIFLNEDVTPTLAVTIGRREVEGAPWHTLNDGDWLGMWHGAQGSFHSFAVFRVDLTEVATPTTGAAGAPAQPEKLQLEAWVAEGCEKRAVAKQPVVWGYPAEDPPAESGYVVGNTEQGEFGALLYFQIPSIESVGYCNAWMKLRLRVRHVKSGAWGESSVWIQLYDTNP